MKRINIIISLIIVFGALAFSKTEAQITSSKPEIAKWASEQDENSFWEFKNDGKLYATYIGSDQTTIYKYTISSTPPFCQEGVSLSIEENIKYLQLTHEKYGYLRCFYIYALNGKRLTVMDAESGHIFPMVKAED